MSESDASGAFPIVSKNAPPTVAVIGCGGGGINMVRRALPDIKGRVTYCYIDTSEGANLKVGEKAHIIGTGSGSGAVRSQNVAAVEKSISRLSDEDLGLADINIIVSSLSGGSGSVISPLLISDIAVRRNASRPGDKRLVIALVIASSQDKIHTQNMLDTLLSLATITDTNNIYLPISIFDNSVSISAVNRIMPTKIARLVDMLTAPTTEADRNDRMNWVNAPKALRAPIKGLRLLYVAVESDVSVSPAVEIWPAAGDHIYDSVLVLNTENRDVETRPDAHIVLEGMFTSIEITPMIGIIGNTPGAFDDLNKRIRDKLHRYETSLPVGESTFSEAGTPSHKSGLHGV